MGGPIISWLKKQKGTVNKSTITTVYETRVPDSEDNMNRRLVRLDSRIRNQFDLIASRTGWLLTSHAFLLAASVAILNGSIGLLHVPELIRTVSLFLMTFVGAFTSVLIHMSVKAAYIAIDDLKTKRKGLLKIAIEKFGYEDTEPSAAITIKGDLPPKLLPLTMLIVWLAIIFLVILKLFYL